VEFNPTQVASYRLVGYENRMLAKEDFNDDTKDAGEIGAGHTVTALYEIVPAGVETDVSPAPVDPLKYQQDKELSDESSSNELLTLKLRYKLPEQDNSVLLSTVVTDEGRRFATATPDFKFASAVAAFGMLLRDSEFKGEATMDGVLEIATEGASHDPGGYRGEFLVMVRRAKRLMGGG
jgi:Ca-activated chloride channel family protein